MFLMVHILRICSLSIEISTKSTRKRLSNPNTKQGLNLTHSLLRCVSFSWEQRRQRSYYEIVYGKAFHEQDMMDYIDKHKDYDKAGYARDDDFHWAYLPMSDGMTAVKCGGTFRSHCVHEPNRFTVTT